MVTDTFDEDAWIGQKRSYLERNIPVPVASEQIRAQSEHTEIGPNYTGAILGLVICLVGLGLTIASSGQTIFYGAILVGFVMMIKNMIPS